MLGRFIKNWINIISNSQYVSIGLAIAEELLWDEAAGEAPFFGVWLGLASPPGVCLSQVRQESKSALCLGLAEILALKEDVSTWSGLNLLVVLT